MLFDGFCSILSNSGCQEKNIIFFKDHLKRIMQPVDNLKAVVPLESLMVG